MTFVTQGLAGIVFASAAACTPLSETYVARPVTQGTNAPARSEFDVSIREELELSSPSVGVLSFDFENRTETFLHVDDVLIDFGDERKSQALSVLEGDDLDSWGLGIARRNQARQANREAGLLALALIADVAVAAHSVSKSRPPPPPVASWVALSAIDSERYRNSQSQPDNHLFRLPFTLPANLSAKRWVALRTDDASAGCIDFVSLRLRVRELGWRQFATRFRTASTDSEWQASRCLHKRSLDRSAY